jgi:hypothetical protein
MLMALIGSAENIGVRNFMPPASTARSNARVFSTGTSALSPEASRSHVRPRDGSRCVELLVGHCSSVRFLDEEVQRFAVDVRGGRAVGRRRFDRERDDQRLGLQQVGVRRRGVAQLVGSGETDADAVADFEPRVLPRRLQAVQDFAGKPFAFERGRQRRVERGEVPLLGRRGEAGAAGARDQEVLGPERDAFAADGEFAAARRLDGGEEVPPAGSSALRTRAAA